MPKPKTAEKKPQQPAPEKKPDETKSEPQLPPNLPPEMKEKLTQIRGKLDAFTKEITTKFDKYVCGVALLPPPPAPQPGEPQPPADWKDKIHLLILVDDTEPTKMGKMELRDKLMTIMDAEAKKADPNFVAQTVLLTELWQHCYDGKGDLLHLIALSAPVYDTGMLSAIKIAEVHKSMVVKKFEKYIVAYVLAGSLVQGKATKDSDIDVFIVVDDTDVKKMTRAELKDKLRAIIIGMGLEAAEITGVHNKLNVQCYILTDFWDSVREANPVIFTFLRDGVPFYDRGIFMPWKQLLRMGKIKPSNEAIDMYMSSGEQAIDRVKFKLRDIGVEDFFWAIFTPSQAAIMLYGVPPPTPRETPSLMREIFVQKEKLLKEADVAVLDKVFKIRKDIEHGTKKDVAGKEVDELLADCQAYLARLRELFGQIETRKAEETIVSLYDSITTVLRDILRAEGRERVNEAEIVHAFEEEMIASGKIPAQYLRTLHDLLKAKADHDAKKLSKTAVEQVRKSAAELLKFLVEFMQRRRVKDLERVRVRIKSGEKFGEAILLGTTAFVVKDIDDPSKPMEKAAVKDSGELGTFSAAAPEEFEKALADFSGPQRAAIKEKTFESLKRIFGADLEIIMG